MFLVLLTYLQPLDAVDACLAEHREYLQRHYAAGVFQLSGPRQPRDGGVILATASAAPAYSLSATLTSIVAYVGFQAPVIVVLAFVLGPMLENNLRKSLILSHGDFTIFIERPISATCLVLAAAALLAPLLPTLARKRSNVALDQT